MFFCVLVLFVLNQKKNIYRLNVVTMSKLIKSIYDTFETTKLSVLIRSCADFVFFFFFARARLIDERKIRAGIVQQYRLRLGSMPFTLYYRCFVSFHLYPIYDLSAFDRFALIFAVFLLYFCSVFDLLHLV